MDLIRPLEPIFSGPGNKARNEYRRCNEAREGDRNNFIYNAGLRFDCSADFGVSRIIVNRDAVSGMEGATIERPHDIAARIARRSNVEGVRGTCMVVAGGLNDSGGSVLTMRGQP
jgi:hypothetical protein